MSALVLLSPHLDDAVLSCWHVLSSSADVVVLNVFTAIPPAGTQTPRWDRVTGSDDSADRMRVYRTQFPAMEAGPLRRLTHPELLRFELLWARASTGAEPS